MGKTYTHTSNQQHTHIERSKIDNVERDPTATEVSELREPLYLKCFSFQ